MIAYRITSQEYAGDLSGRGSFIHGGRWNSPGSYMLYTSTHRSLALLELLAHVPLDVMRQNIYMLMNIEIPDSMHITTLDPVEDLRTSGNDFLKEKKFLSASVPSVIFPDERNIY